MITEKLNQFEIDILERVAIVYPLVKMHIPLLRIKSRKYTGVGLYIHFMYDTLFENPEAIIPNNTEISDGGILMVDGLKEHIDYVVAIADDGRISYIELVTYGDYWDGTIKNYRFIEWDKPFDE